MVDSLAIQVHHTAEPTFLTRSYYAENPKTGLVELTGRHNNLWVLHDTSGLLSIKGSLCVYLRRSNVETMTRLEIETAVERLANRFGFDPHFARVFQLDLAATLALTNPVARYLLLLGSTPRFKRVVYEGETMMFKNKSRSLSFYDKGKESRIKGNHFRFEVKYKQKVRKYFKRSVVLTDLFEKDFFQMMVEKWREAYYLVRKVQRSTPEPVPTPRQLERQLARLMIEAVGGESLIVGSIDTWPYDSARKTLLRRRVRDIADSGTSLGDAALIAELDAAVERAVQLALSS